MRIFRTVAISILALILGFFGLAVVFSDLGRGETLAIRIVVGVAFFLLSGAAIGFLDPTTWIISGLAAWGGILFGGFLTLAAIGRHGAGAFGAAEPPYISTGLLILIGPVTLSLLGGYLVKRLRQGRAVSLTHLP